MPESYLMERMMNKTRRLTPMSKETADVFAEMTETSRLIAFLEGKKKKLKAELDKLYGKRGRIKTYKQGQGVKRARSILITELDEACQEVIKTGKVFSVENAIVAKDRYVVEAHNAHTFLIKEIAEK